MHINRAVKVQPLQVLDYSKLVPQVSSEHPDFFVLNTAQFAHMTLNNNEVISAVNQFLANKARDEALSKRRPAISDFDGFSAERQWAPSDMKSLYFVHESAYVDQPCAIGKDTKIWHFTHIMKDCVIGERCNIGQNVVVSPGCGIGNNVKIQNNVSVYTGVVSGR